MKTGIMVTPRTDCDRAAICKMIVETECLAEWQACLGCFFFEEIEEGYTDLAETLTVMLARYDATARLTFCWENLEAEAGKFLRMRSNRVEHLRKVVLPRGAIERAKPAYFEGYCTFSVGDRLYYDIPAMGTFEDMDFALLTRTLQIRDTLAAR